MHKIIISDECGHRGYRGPTHFAKTRLTAKYVCNPTLNTNTIAPVCSTRRKNVIIKTETKYKSGLLLHGN